MALLNGFKIHRNTFGTNAILGMGTHICQIVTLQLDVFGLECQLGIFAQYRSQQVDVLPSRDNQLKPGLEVQAKSIGIRWSSIVLTKDGLHCVTLGSDRYIYRMVDAWTEAFEVDMPHQID
ncbi:hypothetical protein D3C75_831080 [compost metagenome]